MVSYSFEVQRGLSLFGIIKTTTKLYVKIKKNEDVFLNFPPLFYFIYFNKRKRFKINSFLISRKATFISKRVRPHCSFVNLMLIKI